jgi:hypothetical protein
MMFFEQFASSWPKPKGPLHILEVGVGTGGMIRRLLAVLKRSGVLFVYTMTSIGSAFGAAAQMKVGQYPTAVFRVLDIEREPPADLRHQQHIVLGSNVVHATRGLSLSSQWRMYISC